MKRHKNKRNPKITYPINLNLYDSIIDQHTAYRYQVRMHNISLTIRYTPQKLCYHNTVMGKAFGEWRGWGGRRGRGGQFHHDQR